jgi:hypothetical protein
VLSSCYFLMILNLFTFTRIVDIWVDPRRHATFLLWCWIILIIITVIIIIISSPQSTAGHRPLQFLAISLDLRLLASSSCKPSCANRLSTWPEGVLHFVYLDAVSTPELVYPSGYRFYGWYAIIILILLYIILLPNRIN